MSKLDKNKSDIYRVVVMEVNLEKQTITKWSYMGPEKEIQTVEKCKSNYKPSSNKKNYLDLVGSDTNHSYYILHIYSEWQEIKTDQT